VSGVIIKKFTLETTFKGYFHYASREAPQYLIKSDKERARSNPQRHRPPADATFNKFPPENAKDRAARFSAIASDLAVCTKLALWFSP